eukprot:TRINITY_DN6285_c0_g1_i1.p1 TRINITY_DN6285_c0_g1~~TRINITY_DN6285_c0_g1_i1.p1  ORF type:complete len:292 (+),score=28.95 TRINITY_DN6285_c0_g1_i1:866-1741(+)
MQHLSLSVACFLAVFVIPPMFVSADPFPGSDDGNMFRPSRTYRGLVARAASVNSAPEPDYEFHGNVSFAFIAQYADPKCEIVKSYVGFPTGYCSPAGLGTFFAYSCWSEPTFSGLVKAKCSDRLCQNCTGNWESVSTLDTCSPSGAEFSKVVCPRSGLSPLRPKSVSEPVSHIQVRDYFSSQCYGALKSVRGYVASGCNVDPSSSMRYLRGQENDIHYSCDDTCMSCNSTITVTGDICQDGEKLDLSLKFVAGVWLASSEDLPLAVSAATSIGFVSAAFAFAVSTAILAFL